MWLRSNTTGPLSAGDAVSFSGVGRRASATAEGQRASQLRLPRKSRRRLERFLQSSSIGGLEPTGADTGNHAREKPGCYRYDKS